MKPFVCVWSGGKDACLAMYRMSQSGINPSYLLTMMEADGVTSRAHALPLKLLEQQAAALSLPLLAQPAEDYKQAYLEALATLKNYGIADAVFGDIDLQAHKDWQQEIGELAGFTMHFPLWEENHEKLVHEFLEAGFETVIVAVKQGMLDTRFLGRTLNHSTLKELESLGIDICGEGGEFHTFVVDGPLFSSRVELQADGYFSKKGYDFLKL